MAKPTCKCLWDASMDMNISKHDIPGERIVGAVRETASANV
jgi:hypothetical protein